MAYAATSPEDQADQLAKQKAANEQFRQSISTPEGMAAYNQQVAQRWSDIQNHTGAYQDFGGGGFLDKLGNFFDKPMNALIEATPYALAAALVVATAGAGATALSAATQAGETVAASGLSGGAALGAVGQAAGSAVTAAAAADAGVAATVASIPVVTVTGSTAAAAGAMTGAQMLAGAGIATGVAAAATGAGSSAAPAANTASTPANTTPNSPTDTAPNGSSNGTTIDADGVPHVAVTGQTPGTGLGLPAAAGAAAAGGIALDASQYGTPNITPDNTTLTNQLNQDMAQQHQQNVDDANSVLGSGTPTADGLPKVPGVPATGSNSSGSGLSAGGLLTGGAIAAALDAFNAGNKETTANPALTSSMNSLTSNANDQMSQWHDWMFPTLQSALASNKSATDAFVSSANANAGQMEDMAGQQKQAAADYLARNNSVYVPLADKIIADANAFNKEGYGAQQAGLAVGDLSAAYAAQRQAQAQQMAQYGVSPDSGRAMAMNAAGGVTNAANVASAATRARIAAEDLWGTKQMNALNTSQALNANMNTYAGLNAGAGSLYTGATNARNQGVNATSQYFTNADALANASSNTYNTANNAYSSAGNLGLGLSKLDNDRYIAEQQGRGTVLGAGLQALGGNGGLSSAAGNVVNTATNWLGNLFSGSGSSGSGSTDWNAIRNAGGGS